MEILDSYERFMDKFNIDKEEMYQFGISETILPPLDLVAQNWEELKKRIFNNGAVRIRGYGRDAKGTEFYIGLYKHLFKNMNVKKDATNNVEPQKIISRLTGYKRNKNLFNYQVSHIFGKTKNVFLFEAPWNIALVPKLIDPFTGHEAKGVWPKEYQEKFFSYSSKIYKEYIDEYNYLISNTNILEGIAKYIDDLKKKGVKIKEVLQFEKDVMVELSQIEIAPDDKIQPYNVAFLHTPPDTFSDNEGMQDFYSMLLKLKHEKNRSWVQLRNGCMDLIGLPLTFTTQPMKNTSRAFAREAQKATGLSYEGILQVLEEKKLGLK